MELIKDLQEDAKVQEQQDPIKELSLAELGWVGGGTGSFHNDV